MFVDRREFGSCIMSCPFVFGFDAITTWYELSEFGVWYWPVSSVAPAWIRSCPLCEFAMFIWLWV